MSLPVCPSAFIRFALRNHPSTRRTAVGVGADLGAHVGEGVEVVISGQVPIGADRVGVDPGRQLAERGVGVDGHHPVILADLREAQPCAGRDGGFADPGRRGGGHGP